MNYIKFAGDLMGMKQKVTGHGRKCPRTYGVMLNVVGRVINMAIMASMAAGAIVYAIDLFADSPKRNTKVMSSKEPNIVVRKRD